jgi:gp32 DNA binding protein like
MEDLFNLNADDFTGKAASSARFVDENMYNPGPDQGQNGIYKSVMRFIPWVGDPSKSKYKKYAAKLVNPLTGERIVVDCPSTNGKSSILWSLDLELKKLKNEEPSIVEEIQKNFNRYYNYYSCVYIKKDPQFPTMEGKIKVYSYGYTIDNLIQQEINPESELVTTQKINPFSLTQGKDFVLVIKRKTKAWRDFSASKFMSEVSPLIITHNGQEIPVTSDPKVMQFVTEYFKKNSPDLSQYFYKEWTDHEYEQVAEYIKAIVPYKQLIDNLVTNTKDERMKKHFTRTNPVSRTSAPAGESLDFIPSSGGQTKSTSLSLDDDMNFGSSSPSPAPSSARKDDLDDLFADL